MINPENRRQFRVALIAGTLRQGGAEKQLVYLAQALRNCNVDVRVFCLTSGEFYERTLETLGIPFYWFGYFKNPMVRLANLTRRIISFRPQVIQATHAFVNIYAATVGRICNTISVGAIRSNLAHMRNTNGLWTNWLINMPTALVANSTQAINELDMHCPNRIKRHFLLANAVNCQDYDLGLRKLKGESNAVNAIFVGRLIRAKRVDVFLQALAMARAAEPSIRGQIVGDGPERHAAERLANRLSLLPEHLTFVGHSNRVPELLTNSDIHVLSSDNEGSPNVILEAMSARLPVIATPAGDAKILVEDGNTGFLVKFKDSQGIANRIVDLSRSASLRNHLGENGRARVERDYGFDTLPQRALAIYRNVAMQEGDQRVLKILQDSQMIPAGYE